jgi:predicted RNase H-like HicB family nuclease
MEGKLAVPVLISSNDHDGYTAVSPVLSGCIAEGNTEEAALEDFKHALAILLKTYASEKMPVPWKCGVVLPLSEAGHIFVLEVDSPKECAQ